VGLKRDMHRARALHGIIVIDKACLLWVIRSCADVVIVTFGQFFLLARSEHALNRDTDGHHAQGGRPVVTENGSAYVAVRVDVGVYRWFDFIRNDELDGRRLEGVLRIEPDHEMEYFILVQAFPKIQ